MTETKTQLSADAAEARREYMRRWRSAHRERCRDYQVAFWERRAARAREEVGEVDR